MQSKELVIKFNFPRSTTLNSNDRHVLMQEARIKKHLRLAGQRKIMKVIDKASFPIYTARNPCTVSMLVYPPTNRFFDPDNFQPTLKPLMDGFTEGGLWTDDNYRVVKSTSYAYGGRKSETLHQWEFEVHIQEIEREGIENDR